MILQLPTSPNMPNDPWRSIEPFICSIHVNLEPPTVINFPYHPCLYYTLSPHYSHFNLTSSSPKTLLADAVPLIFMTLSNHSSRADIPTYPNVTSKWVLTQLSQCLVSPHPQHRSERAHGGRWCPLSRRPRRWPRTASASPDASAAARGGSWWPPERNRWPPRHWGEHGEGHIGDLELVYIFIYLFIYLLI